MRFQGLALFLTFVLAAGLAAAQAPAPQDVDQRLAQAMALHEAGDVLGAIAGYKAVLDIDPSRADARANLGAAYARLGEFAKAVEEYRAVLARQDDPTVRLNLGLALYKSGQIADAIAELRATLAADSGNNRAALVLADCLLQEGRDDQVVDLLAPRESAFAEDLAYAYILGMALVRSGDADRGHMYVDRIFKRGDSAEGRLLMGLAYLRSRDFPSAVKELAKAIELNPTLPSVQQVYGRAVLGSGDREAAARAFRRELQRNPNDFEANLQLGNLLRIDQKYDEALVYLGRASALRPNHPIARHASAAVHLAKGDADRARELLEPLVKEVPDYVDAHVLLATAYYRLNRKEDGDRVRQIVEKLNAEIQARQPGAKPQGGTR